MCNYFCDALVHCTTCLGEGKGYGPDGPILAPDSPLPVYRVTLLLSFREELVEGPGRKDDLLPLVVGIAL